MNFESRLRKIERELNETRALCNCGAGPLVVWRETYDSGPAATPTEAEARCPLCGKPRLIIRVSYGK